MQGFINYLHVQSVIDLPGYQDVDFSISPTADLTRPQKEK